MKKLVLILSIAALSAACDKPVQAPATEATEPAKTAGEATETEPTPQAESTALEGVEQGAKEVEGGLPADIQAGETKYYGDRFTVIEPPITLAKAIETADEHAGPYKVEATIAKVCKNKGCWFTMKDDTIKQEIRVRMKDYGFFVPRNADGSKAIVEGTLASREMSEKEAQHYADDAAAAGETPEKVAGAQKVWEFTATAIELSKAEG